MGVGTLLFLTCVVTSCCRHPAKVLSVRLSVKPDDLVTFDQNEYLRYLLDREDTVSAVLHFVEMAHNRSMTDPRRCVRVSMTQLGYQLSNRSYENFHRQALTAVKTANILNNLFLRMSNESNLTTRETFYFTLSRVNVKSDPVLQGSGIAFYKNDHYGGRSTLFYPHVRRQGRKVIAEDLSEVYNFSYDDPAVVGTEWFWKQATKNFSDVFLEKYGLNSSAKLSAILEGNSDLVVDLDDGVWTSPYLDCSGSDEWTVTFSAPFFGRRNNTIEFRGVATVSVDLQRVGVNQCAQDGSLFADTHKCDRLTTRCVPIPGMGFRRGAYTCQCQPGYYFPLSDDNTTELYFNGAEVEEAFLRSLVERSTTILDQFLCLPCKLGCDDCVDTSPCYVEYNMLLRSLVLGLQSFSSTITVVLAVVIFRLRKSKTIANAMWMMLEALLFGALLIYQTVIIRYFEPSVLNCLIEPWFREIGFAVCYGAIFLKIYRILAEFQTRKAHRVCVRDKDLLKYLLGIVLVIVGYMAAWTAVVLENVDEGHSIVEEGRTADGLRYTVCRALWWDYITETGEILFLLLGVYLTYCIRNAKGDCYKEKCTLCWAVYIELLFSFLLYSIRHIVWLSMEPDYLFFMYFLRCQLTTSLNLILIFTPKLWYHHRPPDALDHNRSRHLSSCDMHDNLPEAMKLHEAIMSNGELDFTDINLADMDPEDIRAELRRVYTQLQVLRNKTMRKDNPHISKRRGGRKVTHRRFSLQPFHHKHKHQHEHDHEMTEVSKTPEESTASIEGTQPDGPSTRTEESAAPKQIYK